MVGTRSIRQKRSQIQSQSQLVFAKGTYVAFVDPSDLNNFKIGLVMESLLTSVQLLNDLKEEDDEVLIDIFQQMAPLVYQKQASRQPVPDYTIITDVTVTQEKPTKRGEKAKIKITKQQFNKANKLMDSVVQRIEQEKDDEEDDDEDEDTEEDEDEHEEDEEDQDGSEMHKESPAAINGRRILKGRSSMPAVQKKRLTSSQSQRAKAANGKKADVPKSGAKPKGRSRKAESQDEEMDADVENEEEKSEEIVMIDTTKKSTRQKKAETIPQVGKKRLRTSKKKIDDEMDGDLSNFEESGQPMEDDGSYDDESKPVKKRKVGGGKEKIVKPKVKKPPKRPTVFKKGKWNPDIELVDIDKYKEGETNDLYLDCCIRCNNKNIIRAAITNNTTLLKNGIDEKKKISSLTAYWSPEIKKTALDFMIADNNHKMLEILLHPKLKVPAHSTYEMQRNSFYAQRTRDPLYLLQFVDSGMVSNMAYGVRVRRVQQTRGNRQGNNAFLEYEDNREINPVNYISDYKLLTRLFYSPTVNYETLKQIYKLCPNIEQYLQTLAYEAVRAGNREIAYELIKAMAKYPNFGFNQLHVDVLSTDAELDKVLKQSVSKKANTNRDITPLHCACINPNPTYLKQLMDVNPDFLLTDTDLRKPVHYAAACVGPEPLQILIQAGATLHDPDNQKRNCLHIAAMTGRAHNVDIILKTAPNLLLVKDKGGMNAMAYACKYGHTEVVKILLEHKAKVNAGCGSMRMPPLSWAAAYGHLELCEYLVDNKGRTLSKDKFKRTPLIMAVRNGHTKIASLLLQRGSEWNHPDSSMNTPLHYAAAYGWLDCIDLLIKAGADINAQNSWKVTPINIAMLKNHQGCVKRLLEEPNVDVNGKDEKGRTLIMLALSMLEEDSKEFVSFLLKKGANPNIADLEGQTSLHYIAKYQPRRYDHSGVNCKRFYQQQVEIQKKITQLLIQHDADLTIKDQLKRTPFTVCLEQDNAPLLEFLKDKVSLNKEPEILFAFKDKIFNVQYQRILERIILNDPPLKETINALDDEGFTPFLKYVKSFTDNYHNFFNMISEKVQSQGERGGDNFYNYQITNEDIYDKFQEVHVGYGYNYNPLLTQEVKNEITHKFIDKILVEPFIKMLKFLIEQGADPNAQVGKLKKYRDLELQQRQNQQALAEGREVKIEKKEEKIVRREEKLKELENRRQKSAPRAIRKGFGFGGYNPGIQNSMQQQVDSNDQGDVYDRIDGKKVLREYSSFGKQNAIHLIIKRPQEQLFKYLLSLNINPDEADYDNTTPFTLISRDASNSQDSMFHKAFKKLLDMQVRIDFPDNKGRTPFLNYYDKQDFEKAYKLLDMGANVNQMDTSGLFAMKYALIRRQNNRIQELLNRGANINQVDNKGRNLLHHAINMSSASADATFETEQFLIDNGISINLRDNKNRTPLHYAFVKIQDWKNCTQIDPIETVSSICGCRDLEIDVPDKWQKTPLHYASQRGASICAMYLVQRGADIEKKDIYGNTPLGVGLMNAHYNYGIILIQKQASVYPLVYREDPERIKKQWEEEERKQKELYRQHKRGEKANHNDVDEEMEDEDVIKTEVKQKKHRNMFNSRGVHNDYGDYGDEYDDEDDDYNSDDAYQENVFNQQNAFGMNVYNTRAQMQKSNFGIFGGFGGYNGFGQNNYQSQQVNQNNANTKLVYESDKEGVSMFKVAIRGAQQGLAYLMLDNGYDLMHAMQDAMDEKKFMLVLTLLSKNPNDEVIQSKNKKGQNLFHILSMNASSCSYDHLKRIYETLLKRGVDVQAKDIHGRNALHYAVISGSVQLVKLLLSQDNGYNPNEVDNEGHTPLSLCLKGYNSTNKYYNPGNPIQLDNIFMCLVKSGADVNFLYPEESFKPAFREDEVDDLANYDPKGQYYTTPLINLIRQQPNNEIMRCNMIGLMEYGAKLDVQDSDGRDPIMYAIITNNQMVVEILLNNTKALRINTEGQDKAGKSAVHYVINPLRYGTFENVLILNMLHKHKFNLKLKDSIGRTPASYAAEQESGVLLKELARLAGQENELNNFQRSHSMIESQKWPEQKVDFDQDSEEYMQLVHEREKSKALEEKSRVPVDKTGKFEISYSVYYDENDKPWDCYLTKVDLKNGIYGDYVFYKMQLLYDSNRDLYVVFTRWGRIGETGMNQRTPFNNLDEAKQDFKKIFKQKTGGNDFEDLENFQRVKKKYNITRVNYITVNYKDYLQPFDFDKCPKSKLPSEIYELFEEMSNVTMYQKAMTQYGLDTEVLPFSAVKKESIVEARQILMEIQECLNEDTELSKEGINADYDALTKVKEKLCELSSRYYELIPLARYKNQIAPPLNSRHLIKEQYDMIDGLTNIEYASKMLLAALLKQNEMNPIDYVYHALNLIIEPLQNESPEYEVIRKYIDNTRQDQSNQYGHQYEIAHIFKFQRKGEAEMIQAYKDVPNHFLLFHGSQMFNYLGILSQGLRIAPPEAPTTGYMFGKGVYFADMFDKSFAYAARGYQQQDSYLMLMCEVVLGKSKELYQAEYIENLEHPYSSVKGLGRTGPGYKHTVVCPNGVKIPLGKVIDYSSNDLKKQRLYQLQHNEYIVYNTSQIRMRYLVQIKKKDLKKQR